MVHGWRGTAEVLVRWNVLVKSMTVRLCSATVKVF